MPPRKSSRAKKKVEAVVEQPVEQEVVEVAPPVEETVDVQSKGKGKADIAMEDVSEQTTADEQDGAKDAEQTTKGVKLTPEERLAKLKELRTRMVRPSLATPYPNLIPVLCRTNPPSRTARP
jgi:hypothetical protein